MAKALVIVESPAKAKTISQYLGSDYDVRPSVGHIADLPSKGLAVDVDNNFAPDYELTERGRTVVKELKELLKDASALYLATDEDREGEAISWHLLERLKPKVPVHRMVFHEINKKAIEHAVANPRDIDYGLVDAAETRRILDRLYGYEVSPVLWRRVRRGLSAGRVQSPALRLIVDREWERIEFRSATYFDIDALTNSSPSFTARLVAVNGNRLATGKDFDETGNTKNDAFILNEARANELVAGLRNIDLTVRSVEDKPYRSSPKPPFTTSTLQQEGGRKLRLSGRMVMSTAQSLYENGYITYMRTDSVSLSDEAIGEVRSRVKSEYGDKFITDSPRVYTSKVKNAQEAHEAIRPALPLRSPEQVAGELKQQELALYRLIWQRTLASQMADATGVTVSVRLGATANDAQSSDVEFSASGTTVTFPGYRQAYEESTDDDTDTDSDDKALLLPPLIVGQGIGVSEYIAQSHATTPPPRYTEASIVKKLEELGIGRPSTWASIISSMVDRGFYLWKKGNSLVPTWLAFSVVRLMKEHFTELIDFNFTAGVEEDLDAIARGEKRKVEWLKHFYFGDDVDENIPGLKKIVSNNLDTIDAAEINTVVLGKHPDTGDVIIVKPGQYGPFVRCAENTAGVPDSMAPDELTVDAAIALLNAPKGDEPIGEIDGHPVFAKSGRYGPYVQWGTMDEPPAGLDKPKTASLFKTMNIDRITMKDATDLLSLPRTLGADPTDGEIITAQNGPYGPYISKGKEKRPLQTEEQLLEVNLDEALALLAQPRVYGRGRSAPKPPLREFGNDPVSGKPVVAKEGRFGDYVTDGETNAGLTRGDRLEEMTNERAYELLQLRREYIAEHGTKKKPARKAAASKKTAGAKKTAPKKATTKKKAAQKKKAAPKKKAPEE